MVYQSLRGRNPDFAKRNKTSLSLLLFSVFIFLFRFSCDQNIEIWQNTGIPSRIFSMQLGKILCADAIPNCSLLTLNAPMCVIIVCTKPQNRTKPSFLLTGTLGVARSEYSTDSRIPC